MRDERRAVFVASIAALVVTKLWLVHGEDIVGSATQFDALWYVRSAAGWYWWRPYDWTAFIRPCAYPLWIATIASLQIPLRLAIELLQLGGAAVLVAGLRTLGVSRWVSVAGFAVICFHPAGFQLNDYTMSDTFYAGVLWYLLGALLFTIARPSAWSGAAAGIAAGILWHTREEALLLVLLLPTALAFGIFRTKKHPQTAHVAFLVWAKPLAFLVLTAVSIVIAGYATNRAVYRSFARSEMTAPAFQALFHSLLRIRPNEAKSFAPVTTDTLKRAFTVSPTFALLREQLEAPMGEAWRVETYRQTGVPGEIGVGWIVWAIRQAASENGFFETPAKAQQFFRSAAREINAAADDGRLPTRLALDGFNDPLTQTGGFARLPHSSGRIVARIFARWTVRPIADDTILTSDEKTLYDKVTLRRPDGAAHLRGVAAALEDLVGRYHFIVVIVLHLAAVIALVAAFVARRELSWNGGITAIVVLLGSTVLWRLGLLAWLDATAFDATQDRFLFPVLPLWSAVLVVIAGQLMTSFRARAPR